MSNFRVDTGCMPCRFQIPSLPTSKVEMWQEAKNAHVINEFENAAHPRTPGASHLQHTPNFAPHQESRINERASCCKICYAAPTLLRDIFQGRHLVIAGLVSNLGSYLVALNDDSHIALHHTPLPLVSLPGVLRSSASASKTGQVGQRRQRARTGTKKGLMPVIQGQGPA